MKVNNHFIPHLLLKNKELHKTENKTNGQQSANADKTLVKKTPLINQNLTVLYRNKRDIGAGSPAAKTGRTAPSSGDEDEAISPLSTVKDVPLSGVAPLRNVRRISDTPSKKNLRPDELSKFADKQIVAEEKPFFIYQPPERNVLFERIASARFQQLPTPGYIAKSELSSWLRKKLKQDIDPAKTDVVVLQYNYENNNYREYGYQGAVKQKITLLDAALRNWREPVSGENQPTTVPSPLQIVEFISPSFSHQIPPNATHSFVGIFKQTSPETYTPETQLNIPPSELVEKIRSIYPEYTSRIKGFWEHYREDYRVLSKISFLQASEYQLAEHSLSPEGYALVRHAAGVPFYKEGVAATDEITNIKSPDSSVTVAPLKVSQYTTTDILVIADRNSNHKLLYIPGNSSPFHEFPDGSDKTITKWLQEQLKDPAKKNVIARHFNTFDRTDTLFKTGVDSALTKASQYPEAPILPPGQPPASSNSYVDVDKPITGDIFNYITDSWQNRTIREAEEIPSNTAADFRLALDYVNEGAQFLWPLALAFPAADVALGTLGLINVGQGIADVVNSRTAEGQKAGFARVTFGSLNAVSLPGSFRSFPSEAFSIAERVPSPALTHSESIPLTDITIGAVPARGAESAASEVAIAETSFTGTDAIPASTAMAASASADISAFAVPEGEHLLKGVTPYSRGIYLLNQGPDNSRWFIRSPTASGKSEVYEIRSDASQKTNYANIIDPQSRKAVLTVHYTGDGKWARIPGPGGARTSPDREAAPAGRSDSSQPGPSGVERMTAAESEAAEFTASETESEAVGHARSPRPGPSGIKRPATAEIELAASAAKRPATLETPVARSWQEPLNQVSVGNIRLGAHEAENSTALQLAVANEAYRGGSAINLAEAAERVQNRFDSPTTRNALLEEMQSYTSGRLFNPVAPLNSRIIPNLKAEPKHILLDNIADLDSKLKTTLGNAAPGEGEVELFNIALFKSNAYTYSKQARSQIPLKNFLIQRDPAGSASIELSKYYIYDPSKGSYQFNKYAEMKEWLSQGIPQQEKDIIIISRAFRNNKINQEGLTNLVSVNTLPFDKKNCHLLQLCY